MILAKEKETKIKDSQKKIGFMKKLKQIRKLLISKPTHKSLKSGLPTKLTISVEEYEVSVFERLLRYIHCGVVSVDVFTVVGKSCLLYIILKVISFRLTNLQCCGLGIFLSRFKHYHIQLVFFLIYMHELDKVFKSGSVF